MNYLQLCQRLRQEVGASGTGPTTVLNQSGELARIVAWIATADEDIQRARASWNFMRSSFTVQTVANTAAYSATDCGITSFRDWVQCRFKIYLTSAGVAGERMLMPMEYDDWYLIYNRATRIKGMPINFTILADRSFSLGPIPDNIFTVSGEYQRKVTTLTADTDSPIYPEEYHMLAVYKAMMSYGRYTGATEVYQDGYNRYREMKAQLELTQLPAMHMGMALT